MERQAIVDQFNKGEVSLHDSLKKRIDENRVIVEAKDTVQLSSPSPIAWASLGPITPDSNKETGEFLVDLTSPLTVVSLHPKALCLDSNHNDNDPDSWNEDIPRTPKDGVFDPFAPGPDHFMLAPLCRKYTQESRSFAARRLNFNSSVKLVDNGDAMRHTDAEAILDEEEMLLQTVYRSLLEAIVSKQTEVFLAETSTLDPCPDGLMTPTSAPLLNGIAETCPDAPIKSTKKSRNIDSVLCRRLEF